MFADMEPFSLDPEMMGQCGVIEVDMHGRLFREDPLETSQIMAFTSEGLILYFISFLHEILVSGFTVWKVKLITNELQSTLKIFYHKRTAYANVLDDEDSNDSGCFFC